VDAQYVEMLTAFGDPKACAVARFCMKVDLVPAVAVESLQPNSICEHVV
jgi:hypothetical protein